MYVGVTCFCQIVSKSFIADSVFIVLAVMPTQHVCPQKDHLFVAAMSTFIVRELGRHLYNVAAASPAH